MSQADLAGRMAELGTPWKRATVVNLEKRGTASRGTGIGRDAVTLQEWLHLAEALNTPPPLLLADPRRDAGPIPIADGVELDAWSTLLWLIGSGTLSGDSKEEGVVSHPQGSQSLDLIWHGRVVAEAAGAIRRSPVWMVERFQQYPAWIQLNVPGASSDDPQGQRRALDDMHRRELHAMREAMERIAELGAAVPQVGPKVRERAAELGVDLPGEG